MYDIGAVLRVLPAQSNQENKSERRTGLKDIWWCLPSTTKMWDNNNDTRPAFTPSMLSNHGWFTAISSVLLRKRQQSVPSPRTFIASASTVEGNYRTRLCCRGHAGWVGHLFASVRPTIIHPQHNGGTGTVVCSSAMKNRSRERPKRRPKESNKNKNLSRNVRYARPSGIVHTPLAPFP